MPNPKHQWKHIDFASFINLVMWNRVNARVWPGPMGLCFSWQGARGQTFAAFRRGNGVMIYRAMNAVWPVQSCLVPTRGERQEKMQIGPFHPMIQTDPERFLGPYAPQ